MPQSIKDVLSNGGMDI